MTEINLKIPANATLQFHSFTFHQKKGSIITLEGKEIFMEPRLKDFFHILLLNKNDVVTREDLMDFVWKDAVVTKDSVSKAASDLRKFLIKNEIAGVTVETINKLGYILKVSEVPKTNKKRILVKTIAYSFGILLFLVLLTRALRYEQ